MFELVTSAIKHVPIFESLILSEQEDKISVKFIQTMD